MVKINRQFISFTIKKTSNSRNHRTHSRCFRMLHTFLIFSKFRNQTSLFLCNSSIRKQEIAQSYLGIWTSKVIISSPVRKLFIGFTPLLRKLIFVLHCVPGGTVTSTSPDTVGTVIVPPRIAVVIEIGTVQWISAPWREKKGSGWT